MLCWVWWQHIDRLLIAILSEELPISGNKGSARVRRQTDWLTWHQNFNGFHADVYVSDLRMSPSLCSELLIVIPAIFCRGLRDHQETTVSARLRLALQFHHGAEDVAVPLPSPPAPPRHVQRLPPLPRRWWEWLEGTCPDRVGGCSPFCPKTLLRWRQTLIHAVSWLRSSQGVAKPRAAYLSSCDTHTLTAVPSLQNTHVAIYLCRAIKNNYIMAEVHAAVERHFKREFTQIEKQNFNKCFVIYLLSYIISGNDPFFLPRFSWVLESWETKETKSFKRQNKTFWQVFLPD